MIEKLLPFTQGQPTWMQQALTALVAGTAAILIALAVHHALFRLLRKLARASDSQTDDILVRRLIRPTRYALMTLGLVIAARELPALEGLREKLFGFLMPALVGWVALAILNALVEVLNLRNDISVADNREARRRRTRLMIFSRIATFIVVFVTVGLMLLSIPTVRDIGVALMASAGLAGLAVGAAAQPALKSLIGGLQMAITEPVSIDDVVIISDEWGRVEDIRTTYVVVRTWDERRLIVPITKFLEETFQNWTRDSADLLAPVILYLDPLADIAPLRAEFEQQVEAHDLWDKRVRALQVTDTSVDAIEVRLLMSAADASAAFDLRCAIRESMLSWIRENQPTAIVRRRIAAEPVAAGGGGGTIHPA